MEDDLRGSVYAPHVFVPVGASEAGAVCVEIEMFLKLRSTLLTDKGVIGHIAAPVTIV